MKECIFCNIVEDGDQTIVVQNETCYYIKKKSEQKILEGSGLIIPKTHRENVFELTEKEWRDTRELLLRAKELLGDVYQPDGYSVGWNTGEAGGQSIPHAHLHVIPRFADEPHAYKGIRYWLKQPENKRAKA
ncbi:HIT family protein [Thalassobacillus pellis]|uniref:HIT family protein n=1 Tax=Thalassobacillus pellis TaxID=748008 RepID=UPI00195F5598|nr:HIT domain-containing protein [Thalassobacillus pellis]MBM7551997.1 diadenosine tetraphosphate (Ap4A) HIT family hydrolase [Thalassobacillus pellis]